MDTELIKELVNESKPIFEKIEAQLQKLSSDKNEQTIITINKSLRSVSGAAEMFGFDTLCEYLATISQDIEQYKNKSASGQEINILSSKLLNCFDVLKMNDHEVQLNNLGQITSVGENGELKNDALFPVKLYVFENDRSWEYKNVMLAFENIDVSMVTDTKNLESGILITSPEALKANNKINNDKLCILVIGDYSVQADREFVLPISSDPAVIMAVCKIINRFTN